MSWEGVVLRAELDFTLFGLGLLSISWSTLFAVALGNAFRWRSEPSNWPVSARGPVQSIRDSTSWCQRGLGRCQDTLPCIDIRRDGKTFVVAPCEASKDICFAAERFRQTHDPPTYFAHLTKERRCIIGSSNENWSSIRSVSCSIARLAEAKCRRCHSWSMFGYYHECVGHHLYQSITKIVCSNCQIICQLHDYYLDMLWMWVWGKAKTDHALAEDNSVRKEIIHLPILRFGEQGEASDDSM